MPLKTSLVISGDASGAVRAVDDATRSVKGLTDSSRAAVAGSTALERAQRSLERTARAVANAEREAADVGAEAARAHAALSGTLTKLQGDYQRASSAATAQSRAIADTSRASNDNASSTERHAMGVRNLGQQFADLAVMMQGGVDPARAFSSQAGQMGYAMSELNGKMGAVGRFLVGPWGIALTVAAGTLAPFVEKLFETEDAANVAEKATASLAEYVGDIGNFFDRATGKIKETNAALIQYGALSAAIENRDRQKARRDLAAEGSGIVADSQRSTARYAGSYSPGSGGGTIEIQRGSRELADIFANGPNAKGIDEQLRNLALGSDENASRAKRLLEIRAADAKLVQEIQRENIHGASLLSGTLDSSLRTNSTRRTRSPQRASNAGALKEFGSDAGDRLAGIVDRFGAVAPIVRQIEQATRQVDDLIDDLGRRKPLGFEKLIADAKTAKGVIAASINKPYDDLLAAQQEQLQLGALVNQERLVEAEALRSILGIERQRGPLTDTQRVAILGSVAALKQQEAQLERIRAKQQVNLNALRDMQGIISQSIYEGPQSLAALPGRLLDSFKSFQAELITENLFGDMFRDMRDQVLGANKVDQASNTIVSAFGRAAVAAGNLANAQNAAARGEIAPPKVPGAGGDGNGDIVVTARRTSDIYGEGITKALGRLGLGENAAKDIGKYAGRGLAGAFEGQMAGGVASLLGIKTSSTGSAIGGAIGGLTGLPGGSIIGGLLGGSIGSIFAPKVRPGGATVSAVDGQAMLTGAIGSDKGGIAAGQGLGGSVASSINAIVSQLGGTLGSFSVQIGKYKEDLRVNVNGRALGGVKGSGATGFGDDENAAINFAAAQAIAQGAIQGVSAAVAKALGSSSNVDAALKEALKVQGVETLLGGIGGAVEKAFRDFEATAKDRVRIASQYGLDVLAIEKRNAADRTKIAEELLSGQIGSLKQLVDEMTRGSLFEGSAVDRIAALKAEIAKAKADLDAGVEGAGDKLAGLFEQLNGASKAAYGTTGGYAADRTMILDQARAAIAAANARIVEAQSASAATASDPALKVTNEALDENNDQNARIVAALERSEQTAARSEQLLAQIANPPRDFTHLARV